MGRGQIEELPDQVSLGTGQSFKIESAACYAPSARFCRFDRFIFVRASAASPFSIGVFPVPAPIFFTGSRIGPLLKGKGDGALFDPGTLKLFCWGHGRWIDVNCLLKQKRKIPDAESSPSNKMCFNSGKHCFITKRRLFIQDKDVFILVS